MHAQKPIKAKIEVEDYIFHFEFVQVAQLPSLFKQIGKSKRYQTTIWRDGWGHRFTFPYTHGSKIVRPDAKQLLAILVDSALVGSMSFEDFAEDIEEVERYQPHTRRYWEERHQIYNEFCQMGLDDEDLEIISEALNHEAFARMLAQSPISGSQQ